MELCLSLGDASKPFESLKDDQQKQHQNIDLCMALGLNSSASINKEEHEKAHKSYEEENEDDDEIEAPFQLNLLPLAPVPRRFSDYGSSENGSSGNMGMATAKGFDVNRFPATEEVSSANRPFDCLNGSFGDGNILCGYKRDFEATVNDAVEAVRASDDEDDDENGVNTRKKLRLSKEQSAFLEESFKEHNTLNPKQKQALAKQLNLRPRQVEVWFQNRRARTKLKQTEVDCEYLKRCFETLTEENRRLQKELQDLRALKASNPFNMTPLTMCPSCERVATTAAPPPASAAVTGKTDSIPFPFTRPRFYPFSQNPSRPNLPSDGSWKLSKMHT